MTKPKAPLSIDDALARIAGRIPGGYKAMAALLDRHQSTVRAWGDEDKPDQIPLPAAIALDIAYQRAGGEDRPLFETYALQVQVAREIAFADEIELARRACTLIREGAEAQEALVLASLPNADHKVRTEAIRQLQDVVREATGAIALLAGQARAPPDTG